MLLELRTSFVPLRAALRYVSTKSPVLSESSWTVAEVLRKQEGVRDPAEEQVSMAARLAQVPIAEADAERVRANMGELLHFVEYIQQIDTTGVEPLTSVTAVSMRLRTDAVSESARPDAVLANAKQAAGEYFAVGARP